MFDIDDKGDFTNLTARIATQHTGDCGCGMCNPPQINKLTQPTREDRAHVPVERQIRPVKFRAHKRVIEDDQRVASVLRVLRGVDLQMPPQSVR